MSVNLFILGRPGSGKSTAARQISKLAQEHGWLAIDMDDYNILFRMFKADSGQQRFRPTLDDGFDVIDSSVLNEALTELAGRVRKLRRPLENERLVIIEFAPSDYRAALKLFRREIQDNAYFLMLYTDINACIQRKSVAYSPNQGNHFVSEETIRTYYSQNDIPDIKILLETDYGVTNERVKTINNTGSSMSFFKEVAQFAKSILKQQIDRSKETEQLRSIPTLASINEPDQRAYASQKTEPIPVVIPVDESTD